MSRIPYGRPFSCFVLGLAIVALCWLGIAALLSIEPPSEEISVSPEKPAKVKTTTVRSRR